MLDRSLRLTFRDFSTYFLMVATLILPLELIYGAVFSDVIAVRELHDEVERLPEGSALLDVTADRLTLARWSRWGLNLVEVALLPWMMLATRRVLDASGRGETPTVLRSLALDRDRASRRGGWEGRIGPLVTAAGIALAVGLLARYLGEIVTQPFQGPGSWALVSVMETAARSLGAPFLLVGWVQARSGEGEARSAPKMF